MDKPLTIAEPGPAVRISEANDRGAGIVKGQNSQGITAA